MISPLAPWHEFYGLLGTAAASLVALLFVAVSIGASILSPEHTGATRTYMSPVVFHYTAVLFISLIALIPTQTPDSLALSVGALAAVGLVTSIVISYRVAHVAKHYLEDDFAYGILPAVAYAAALVAAMLFIYQSAAAPNVLAGALLLLLVVNIRNAWDLMLAFARRVAALQNKDES
jgi:hypothetical protein